MNLHVIAAQLAVRNTLSTGSSQSMRHAIQNNIRLQSMYLEHNVDEQIEYLLKRLEPFRENRQLIEYVMQQYAETSDAAAIEVAGFLSQIARSELP